MSLFPLYDPSKDYSGFMQAVAAARKPITGTLTAVADLPVSKHTAMQLINNLVRNLPKLKTGKFQSYLACKKIWIRHSRTGSPVTLTHVLVTLKTSWMMVLNTAQKKLNRG